MPWLKKNLTLVIAGVVALGLLGFAGYFLYSKMTHANQVYQALIAQQTELDRLNNLNPHPGNAKINNIVAAQKQAEQLEAVLAEAKTGFADFEFPTNLNSGLFKANLLRAIHDLTRRAERSGVKLGTNFAFSFASLRDQMSVEQQDIPLLARQLAHVAEISRLLIDARVLTIDGIKRPSIEPEKDSEDSSSTTSTTTFSIGSSDSSEPGANNDYWDRRPITNNLAVLYPYSFTFHTFTKELADFLAALSSSPHCFMVKNIAVDTVSSPLLRKPMLQMLSPYGGYGAGMGAAAGMPGGMAGRYGLGGGGMGRYGLGGMPGLGRGPVRRGNKTILIEEHAFRVRAWIYVVSLLPADQQGMAPPPAMAGPYGAGGRSRGTPFDPSILR